MVRVYTSGLLKLCKLHCRIYKDLRVCKWASDPINGVFLSFLPLAPEVITGAVLTTVDQLNNVVLLDWSGAFRLNGPLRVYTVIRNDIIVHQTTLTSVELLFEPMGIRKSTSVLPHGGSFML